MMPWPTKGPNLNEWHENAAAFVKLVQDNPGFWCADPELKYLNVRIDTRSGHFIQSAVKPRHSWRGYKTPFLYCG